MAFCSQIFRKAQNGKIFVRMAYHRLFFVPFYEDLFPNIELSCGWHLDKRIECLRCWPVTSWVTFSKWPIEFSSFTSLWFASLWAEVCSVVWHLQWEPRDCIRWLLIRDTTNQPRQKRWIATIGQSALLLTVLGNLFGCTINPILGRLPWWDQRSAP